MSGVGSCALQEIITIRKAYKYRLYRCDKVDSALHQQINVSGIIWNHALALQKRYWRLFGGYIDEGRMKAHIAKLRMHTRRYAYWKCVGSQAVQDICERLDDAYQKFFNKQAKLPRFKKVKRYKSFTLKQAGWKLVRYNENQLKANGKFRRARGVVEINGIAYKFVQHRPMNGLVKTVTIKRDSAGRLWVCFSVLETILSPERASTSNVGGFDFGLKIFLTDNNNRTYANPLFLNSSLKRIRTLNCSVSGKVKDSHNRKAAQWLLSRTHIRVADARRDFHFKLAHQLCDEFDVLVFEDLNLSAMKKLWGRKVSDLGFGKFLKILEHVAFQRGNIVLYIDRFERTTGICSACRHKQDIALRERTFRCEECGLVIDRDYNAAINIYYAGLLLYAGASAYASVGVVSPARAGSPV